MARRRGYIAPGVDVSPAEMWESIGAIDGHGPGYDEGTQADDREGPVKGRRAVAKTPCHCRCRCGSYGIDGGLCSNCRQDVHHRCSRACGAIQPIANRIHGVKGQTNYIPERRACNGGKPDARLR